MVHNSLLESHHYSHFMESCLQLLKYNISNNKDIVMKILVYEISKTRNLQYDSEQFFKEAEKYLDPQTDPLAPGPSS